ncbi:MAG: cell wall hydrolase [Hyphomicrobiaceae bacterium]
MSRSRTTGSHHRLLVAVSLVGIAIGASVSVLAVASPEPLAPEAGVALARTSLAASAFSPIDITAAPPFSADGKGPRADRVGALDPAATTAEIPAPRLAWTGAIARTARTDLADPLGHGYLQLPVTLASGGVAVPSLSASDGFSSAGYFLASAPFAGVDASGGDGEDLRPVNRALVVEGSVVGEANGRKIFFGGLSEAEFRAKEKRCLATAIYFEARGESIRGQQAVAQVIMNRVRLNYYPNTICGVVYEGADRLNSCQFSFACDRRADVPKEKREWEIANEVAQDTVDGKIWLPEVGTASHYHATYVSPSWTRMMTRTTRIGIHVFYRGKFLGPVDIASSGEDPSAHTP